MMNCQDALNLLYDIIDKEASEIDTEQVQKHLEHCRDCLAKYRLEESVQHLLNEKMRIINNNHHDTQKVDQLKGNILSRLDEIDAEGGKSKPGFFTLTKMFVSVAALVVLVITAFMVSTFVSHYKYYIPIEEAHWSAETDYAGFLSDNADFATMVSAVHDRYEYDLDFTVDGFTLIGGQNQNIMGVEMNHLLYRNNDRFVSVFIAPADKFSIPKDLENEKIIRNHIELYDHNCRGCRLVFQKAGDVIIITASTDRSFDLTEFFPGHPAI